MLVIMFTLLKRHQCNVSFFFLPALNFMNCDENRSCCLCQTVAKRVRSPFPANIRWRTELPLDVARLHFVHSGLTLAVNQHSHYSCQSTFTLYKRFVQVTGSDSRHSAQPNEGGILSALSLFSTHIARRHMLTTQKRMTMQMRASGTLAVYTVLPQTCFLLLCGRIPTMCVSVA